VAFAHAQGVTHGNLTPENIILSGFGEVMVTGWCLRRNSEGAAGAREDAREDLMALGRLLYEIATLEIPPDFTAVRQESSTQRNSVANRERIAQRTPIHYWDAVPQVKTLVNLACRALDRRKVDQFQSVREFQTQVDAFKDTFEDPARLTLLRVLHHWTPGQKAAAAMVIFFLMVAFGALGFGAAQKYFAYRAHQLEGTVQAPKAVDPPGLAEQ
jgi:serine/threonine protein kinase